MVPHIEPQKAQTKTTILLQNISGPEIRLDIFRLITTCGSSKTALGPSHDSITLHVKIVTKKKKHSRQGNTVPKIDT